MSALRVIASFFGAGVLGRVAVSLPSVASPPLSAPSVVPAPPPAPSAVPSAVPPPPAPSVVADAVAGGREELRGKVAGLGEEFFIEDYARPPGRGEVENALAFIAYIPDRLIRTVDAGAAGDADIEFSWTNHETQHHFSVSFDEGGKMGYFGELPTGRIVSDEMLYDKDAGPPDELRRLLASLDL